MIPRPFVREYRPLGRPDRRYAVRRDDKAKIADAVSKLRDIPREVIVSRDEIIHYVQKQARAIAEAASGLEEINPETAKCRVPPIAKRRPQVEHREITAGKGQRVRVLERGRCQRTMELSL